MRARTIGLAAAAGIGGFAAVTRAAQPLPAVHDLSGSTALVTGANSGLGLETALVLARGGARVIVAARSEARSAAAIDQVRATVPDASIEYLHLDLADLRAVREAANEVLSRVPALDVIVNNAGVVSGSREVTADGFELTMGVNHLGPYLFTRLLLPALRAATAARVVTVASVAHRWGRIVLDDLMYERRHYRQMQAYADSKLANVLFARELGNRVASTAVTSNSVHPGTSRTGFGRDGEGHAWLRLGVHLIAPLLVPPERAASTSVHVAASPAVEGVTGHYFSRRRAVPASRAGRDDLLARRLWDASADLVDLPHELTLAG